MQIVCDETSALSEMDSADGTTRRFRSAVRAQDMTVNALGDRRRGGLQTDRALQDADLEKIFLSRGFVSCNSYSVNTLTRV